MIYIRNSAGKLTNLTIQVVKTPKQNKTNSSSCSSINNLTYSLKNVSTNRVFPTNYTPTSFVRQTPSKQ